MELPVLGQIIIQPELLLIPGVGEFSLEYHSVWNAFLQNGLVWDSWHLLGIFTIVLIAASLRWSSVFIKPSIGVNLLILSGLLFIFIVFFFTKHHAAALDNTTINRAIFHMMPLMVFYLLFIALHRNPADPETTAK